jgi:mannose-6-phosphate isomerase
MNNLNEQEAYLKNIKEVVEVQGFDIAEIVTDKPWGAFIRLANKNAEAFINLYFEDIKKSFKTFDDLSPKYLIVAPDKQLSWQYHYRRAEYWRVLSGSVGVKLSNDDLLPLEASILKKGDLVQFPAQKRHRLIGLQDWGAVVEIWEHTDPNQASNEQDIVRVEDDFGR